MIDRALVVTMLFGLASLLVVPDAYAAQADKAAANACAAGLSKDARTIYDATLPKVGPGVDLKSVVTSTTRSLAFAGTIDRGTARDSAQEAGTCLKKAAP